MLLIFFVIIGFGYFFYCFSYCGVVEFYLYEVWFGIGIGCVDWFGECDYVSDKCCSFFDEGWVVVCKVNF